MKNCDIRSFGAVGDGETLDTEAIQKAIDACSAAGGGRVIVSEGKYLCGRINLKSGVDLHIEVDGVLLGSRNGYDFPEIETTFWRTEYAPRFNKRCMIYAEGCENIAITGRGKIDCQGDAYIEAIGEGWWKYRRCTTISPARVVLFMGCRNVLVEDITMCNQPAGWSYWVCDCDHVHFHRAEILASVEYPNNDGIHINCSRQVTVSDCNITCGDDSIVVRAYSLPMYEHKVCEQVTVTNCNLVSHSAGIRVGWINDGVIRNCTFSNLTMTDTIVGIHILLPENGKEDLAGKPSAEWITPDRMSDEGDEETLIEHLSFSNIVMDRIIKQPVDIDVREKNLFNSIRDLHFTDLHCRSVGMPRIVGKPERHCADISFANCTFEQIPPEAVGGLRPNTNMVPDFRHADRVRFENTSFSIL